MGGILAGHSLPRSVEEPVNSQHRPLGSQRLAKRVSIAINGDASLAVGTWARGGGGRQLIGYDRAVGADELRMDQLTLIVVPDVLFESTINCKMVRGMTGRRNVLHAIVNNLNGHYLSVCCIQSDRLPKNYRIPEARRNNVLVDLRRFAIHLEEQPRPLGAEIKLVFRAIVICGRIERNKMAVNPMFGRGVFIVIGSDEQDFDDNAGRRIDRGFRTGLMKRDRVRPDLFAVAHNSKLHVGRGRLGCDSAFAQQQCC